MAKMTSLQHQSDSSPNKNIQAEASALIGEAGKKKLARSGEFSARIKRIKPYPTKKHDITVELSRTWFGRAYTKHLKKYPYVRWIIQWCWRNGYPIYVNHIDVHLANRTRNRAIRWRRIVKLNDYAQKTLAPISKLADEAVVETPEPKIFPSCDHGCIVSPHDSYRFPEIYVATIRNGAIYGGSNFVLVDNTVICHDLYDFERDYTSEELHGRALIDPKARRIRWLVYDEEIERISAAATFVDACAPNYAHWLTEVLPRIAIFCADERFKNIPVVVNDGLHQNIMESLFLVIDSEREVIILPIGRGLHCDKLYITSASGYVPFEWRTTKLSGFSHGVFSPPAFDILRKRITFLVRNAENIERPKKIFLRRNSGYRNVINATEVEELFSSHGYVVVEPEKMNFSQQVELFRNAKTIVSPTGAALANILFAPQHSKIFILISKHPDTIYWYWQNIACVTGKTINYVFGKICDSKVIGIHASFMIDLDDLVSIISELED